MSTVDNEVTPDLEPTPEDATVSEEETDALVEVDDELETESLLAPIVCAESMAITAIMLSAITFFGYIGQWLRTILANMAATNRDDVSVTGKGYAIGGLLVLVFAVIGHLQIRSETPRWARGMIGATTILGLLFVLVGVVLFFRAGAYPSNGV
jgi:glucan phosphoethanolaminetransferase (alkaline phosphatase superfamily)